MRLKKHRYENADGETVAVLVTTDSADMLHHAAEKLKVKFPDGYSFLRHAETADYSDLERGVWPSGAIVNINK